MPGDTVGYDSVFIPFRVTKDTVVLKFFLFITYKKELNMRMIFSRVVFMSRYLFVLFIAIIGCNRTTSINEYSQPLVAFSSSCGGFLRTDTVGLQKVMFTTDSISPQYRISTSEYVAAEQIRWHYNAADSLLDIIHFREVANCAAQLVTTYQVSGTTLFLEETNIGGVSDRCDCVFDQFCRIKIHANVDTLTLANKSWPINLTDTAGSLIVDTMSLLSLGVLLK